MDVVYDGVEALAYLRQERRYQGKSTPDLILLDLNMPRKDGRSVLKEMAADPDLRKIPVIVLTTSGAEQDIVDAYTLGANAYIVKPVSFPDFIQTLSVMSDFWLNIAKLPGQP